MLLLNQKMASILDFVLLLPRCICIPNLLKCSMRIGIRVLRSFGLSVMKMLSLMKKMLLKSNVVLLDEVGCPVSLPFSAFKLPFLGGLKYWNAEGFVSFLSILRLRLA